MSSSSFSPSPAGADSPCLFSTANQYLAAGLCVIPALPDKRPALPAWASYQQHLPIVDQLEDWFTGQEAAHGLGLVCGAVSGGLEVLDLDAKHDPAGDLNARAEAAIRDFAPGVWERCVIERTPSGGLHLYFRSPAPERNLKLAHHPDATGRPNVIAETRGEGGFIVAAPTPGYVLTQGDFRAVPVLTAEEREALLAGARSLDRSPLPAGAARAADTSRCGDTSRPSGPLASNLDGYGYGEPDRAHDYRDDGSHLHRDDRARNHPDGTPPPRPPAAPLTLWAPSQFLSFTPDPSACLLGEGFLELGEWTSFVGIGGLGKTRLVLHLAICQITGRPWCGLETRGAPQKIVYLSTENGLRRWKHDIEKMFASLSADDRAKIDQYLRILALTPDEEADLCLASPDTAGRLKTTLTAIAPGLVIFDPFAEMVLGDENKTGDVIETLRALRHVVRTACPTAAVLIVHHARSGASNVAQAGDNFNAGNFGRGSKALYSRVRCELQLAPQHRDDTTRLVLACGKANNTRKFAPRGITFDEETFTYAVDPTFDLEAWRADVTGKNRQSSLSIQDVVEAVRELAPYVGAETTTPKIMEFFSDSGVPRRTIERHLAAAAQTGYLAKGKTRGIWRLGAKPLAP